MTRNPLENEQVVLDFQNSTVGIVNDVLETNAVLSFKPTFSRTKNVCIRARDTSGKWSAWEKKGECEISLPPAPATIKKPQGK